MNPGFLMISVLVATSNVYAGGMGGSNPPARQALEEMLAAQPASVTAGLFTSHAGNIGLAVKGTLDKEIVLSKINIRNEALLISEADFDALNTARFGRTIDAVSLNPAPFSSDETGRSYQIGDGDSVGQLILTDRREIIRTSIK